MADRRLVDELADALDAVERVLDRAEAVRRLRRKQVLGREAADVVARIESSLVRARALRAGVDEETFRWLVEVRASLNGGS